jgi:cyclopropane fatty-acyl-phospholipid synthase-like methyltransferase
MHDDGYFNARIAERYDNSSSEMFKAESINPMVDFLAELADDGRALELGIGTGSIALPLAQRGVPVHGTDLSTNRCVPSPVVKTSTS